MDWIANIFLVIGLWKIGNKQRRAFLYTVIGEALWLPPALARKDYALFSICFLFLVVAVRNYIHWEEVVDA